MRIGEYTVHGGLKHAVARELGDRDERIEKLERENAELREGLAKRLMPHGYEVDQEALAAYMAENAEMKALLREARSFAGPYLDTDPMAADLVNRIEAALKKGE